VTSPPAAEDALATCLGEFERLGLGRPASVLITEYLAALTAEGVIDNETAARTAAAYHRLRYGSVERDDLEVRDVSARLSAATQDLAKRTDVERRSLAERVTRRLQLPPAAEGRSSAPVSIETTFRPLTLDRLPSLVGNEAASDPRNESATLPLGVDPRGVDPLVPPDAKGASNRRKMNVPLPLELAILVAAGLVVAGYMLRNGIDQSIGRNQTEMPASGRSRILASDVWRHEKAWQGNLLLRAEAEYAKKHDRTARLAYELLVAESPQDSTPLNALAWLYLTSDDPAVHDSKRGLDLALQALAIRRAPHILDTVAEGRYQAGQPDEAVQLEREAIETSPRMMSSQNAKMWAILQAQLEKFEAAAKAAHAVH
jgi:hypothetical protein